MSEQPSTVHIDRRTGDTIIAPPAPPALHPQTAPSFSHGDTMLSLKTCPASSRLHACVYVAHNLVDFRLYSTRDDIRVTEANKFLAQAYQKALDGGYTGARPVPQFNRRQHAIEVGGRTLRLERRYTGHNHITSLVAVQHDGFDTTTTLGVWTNDTLDTVIEQANMLVREFIALNLSVSAFVPPPAPVPPDATREATVQRETIHEAGLRLDMRPNRVTTGIRAGVFRGEKLIATRTFYGTFDECRADAVEWFETFTRPAPKVNIAQAFDAKVHEAVEAELRRVIEPMIHDAAVKLTGIVLAELTKLQQVKE